MTITNPILHGEEAFKNASDTNEATTSAWNRLMHALATKSLRRLFQNAFRSGSIMSSLRATTEPVKALRPAAETGHEAPLLLAPVAGTVAPGGAVRVGRTELACDVDGFAPGTPVTLAIRPEDILAQDAPSGDANVVRVRVDALAFLGSFFRADLVADAMDGVLLRADLSVDLVRRRSIAEKSELSAILPPERIRIYPGDAIHR